MNNTTEYRYQLSNKNSGLDLGIYDATTEAAALDAMAADAGYKDFAASCEAVGTDGSEIKAERSGRTA